MISVFFQIMSDENQQLSDAELNNEVFQVDDGEEEVKQQNDQWIQELRSALERGCDLGAIRNIGKCRALTVDLRLAVWKVRENIRSYLLSFNR